MGGPGGAGERSGLLRGVGEAGTSCDTHVCTSQADLWDFVIGAAISDIIGGSS